MTIEEALANIQAIRSMLATAGYFDRTQAEIMAVLHQLVETQPKFTLEQLCEQLSRLKGSWVGIDGEQEWSIAGLVDAQHAGIIQGSGIKSLRYQLDKLLQPPPQLSDQDVLPVPLSLAIIKFCAGYRDGEIAKACRAVLEKHNDKGTSATKDR